MIIKKLFFILFPAMQLISSLYSMEAITKTETLLSAITPKLSLYLTLNAEKEILASRIFGEMRGNAHIKQLEYEFSMSVHDNNLLQLAFELAKDRPEKIKTVFSYLVTDASGTNTYAYIATIRYLADGIYNVKIIPKTQDNK